MFVNRTPDLPVSESYTLATAAMSGLSYPQSVVGRGQHHPIVNKTDLSGMNELTDFLPIRSLGKHCHLTLHGDAGLAVGYVDLDFQVPPVCPLAPPIQP